jgi:hypothetical protein
MQLDDKTVGRFLGFIERGGADDCWNWTGAKDRRGYGRFNVKVDGRWYTKLAHRLAFLIHYGEWPNVSRHQCDNPSCCNPGHILSGTQRENMRDMADRQRRRGIVAVCGSAVRNGRPPRFTEQDILEIRSAVANGPRGTSTLLAQRYGVSRTQICDIVKRRAWKHVA